MSRVSQIEVEEERRNDAACLGLLPMLPERRDGRVRTGLESTQDPRPQDIPSPSEIRHRKAVCTTARPRKAPTQTVPLFTYYNCHTGATYDVFTGACYGNYDHDTNSAQKPRRVVVVVRRVVQLSLNGKTSVWLKIEKRNDDRFSYRPSTWQDEKVFLQKYPLMFSPSWEFDSAIDCLAEWESKEWKLLDIFDPYAQD